MSVDLIFASLLIWHWPWSHLWLHHNTPVSNSWKPSKLKVRLLKSASPLWDCRLKALNVVKDGQGVKWQIMEGRLLICYWPRDTGVSVGKKKIVNYELKLVLNFTSISVTISVLSVFSKFHFRSWIKKTIIKVIHVHVVLTTKGMVHVHTIIFIMQNIYLVKKAYGYWYIYFGYLDFFTANLIKKETLVRC